MNVRSCVVLLAVGSIATVWVGDRSAEAGIIGSTGAGSFTHTASFDGGPAVTMTTPAGGGNAVIPLPPGSLQHNSVINGVGGDNSQASGSVSQTFNFVGPDSHLVFLPGGFDISVDDTNGSLDAFGLGIASATFRLDFGVNFALDGVMGVVNTFVNMPFAGNVPVGYQVDLAVSATWTDFTTDGDPILAQSTLGDLASFSEVGAFADALVDNGVWGGFLANVNDVFSLAGFLEVGISKKVGAAPAVIQLGLVDQIAIDAGLAAPEPSTLAYALIGGVGLLTRRRRK